MCFLCKWIHTVCTNRWVLSIMAVLVYTVSSAVQIGWHADCHMTAYLCDCRPLRFSVDRSQSSLRIASTASPVSATELHRKHRLAAAHNVSMLLTHPMQCVTQQTSHWLALLHEHDHVGFQHTKTDCCCHEGSQNACFYAGNKDQSQIQVQQC